MIAISLLALLLAAAPARPSDDRARDDLQTYFSLRDYPADARAASAQGIVRVQLGIGPDGRVTDCTITRNSGAASLDAATCRILRERGHFPPPRNARGRPSRGFVEGAVEWRLPPGVVAVRRPVNDSVASVLPDEALGRPGPPNRALGPFPPRRLQAAPGGYFLPGDYPRGALAARREGEVGYELTIGTSGRVSNCRVTRSSGDVALDAATCRVLRERARYIPARDLQGGTTEGVDAGSHAWRLPRP
ncbi:MAG TPA: energy transducer TonB [Allosphingosinicella sp.]|nr:energy transducer TonB [Allosphingosinicella sp.]